MMRTLPRRLALPTLAVVALLLSTPGLAGDGMVRMQSAHDVETTTERLVSALEAKGMTVFDVIDHADGARGVDLELPPTRTVVFGNPKVGTPLMQCRRSVAIDLPQKALIWRDAAGETWLAYNDPQYLVQRHGIEGCEGIVKKIAGALAAFARKATAE